MNLPQAGPQSNRELHLLKRFYRCLARISDMRFVSFAASLDIGNHPVLKARKKTRLAYVAMLAYFVRSCALDRSYAEARLAQYEALLSGKEPIVPLTAESCARTIRIFTSWFLRPGRLDACVLLMCDAALILSDEPAIKRAFEIMGSYLKGKKRELLSRLRDILYRETEITPPFSVAQTLITQFRSNRLFGARQELRVLVTANMSAGKSTLINALVGKQIARSSQEACTASLCYIYSKPFEDKRMHLASAGLNLDAAYEDLSAAEKAGACGIAAYFRTVFDRAPLRLCLIDTPGVNSAINPEHGELTRRAIQSEEYDRLIYVLDAGQLGTEDEMRHLKYVYEHVPAEKIIFVLNKLDCFKRGEDSIAASMEDVKNDLREIGYVDPILCPLSAYFSLLLKRKWNQEELDDNELDVVDLYMKKFSSPKFDLSAYYDQIVEPEKRREDGLMNMGCISGLCGLENILYREPKNFKEEVYEKGLY